MKLEHRTVRADRELRFGLRRALTVLIAPIFFLLALPTVGAAPSLPAFDRVRVLEAAREIADVELIDQHGRTFVLSQLRGRVALVFFGFTNCPDVCPMALQRMKQFEEHGGPELDKLAFVMISVDGERDTPAVLEAFLGKISPRFIGVTGETGKLKAMAAEFKAAFFKGAPNGGSYPVSHSPQVFVVDPDGLLRAEFYSASLEAMAGVTHALLEEAESRRGPDAATRP